MQFFLTHPLWDFPSILTLPSTADLQKMTLTHLTPNSININTLALWTECYSKQMTLHGFKLTRVSNTLYSQHIDKEKSTLPVLLCSSVCFIWVRVRPEPEREPEPFCTSVIVVIIISKSKMWNFPPNNQPDVFFTSTLFIYKMYLLFNVKEKVFGIKEMRTKWPHPNNKQTSY